MIHSIGPNTNRPMPKEMRLSHQDLQTRLIIASSLFECLYGFVGKTEKALLKGLIGGEDDSIIKEERAHFEGVVVKISVGGH